MSKYCGHCDLQVEHCECGNVDHTKPMEKPMSKKMSELFPDGIGFPASWTDEQVRYAYEAINSHDSLTAEVERLREALSEIMASIGGGKKKCGHDFTCVCAEDAARKALEGGDE